MTKPHLLALGLLLMGAGSASAHADYQSSEPARGAVLETFPPQVVLDFTEPVEVRFSLFKVYALDATGSDTPDDEGAGAAESHDLGEDGHDEAGHDEADVGAHGAGGGETPASAATLDAGDLLRLNGRAGLLVADVIALRGDEDARADAGLATTDARAARVVLELKPDLAPGAYVVMWRVLAADTHTTQGFYVFQVAPSP